VGTHEVFEVVALALGTGQLPVEPPGKLWEGLEAFPAYDDGAELEPAVLAAACTAVLGLAPDASGMVDHAPIGEAWEQAGGDLSIVDALFAQLDA
jgi:hypothetical protein